MMQRPDADRPRRGARSLAALGLLLGIILLALGLASRVHAGPLDEPSAARAEHGQRSIQLAVGKAVIVDLPEDAAEIYVGDPKIANAVVRSARRIYVSAVAAGQTTIFALAGDGRRIQTIEISAGRDVGELDRLLKTAIPGNDIHLRTVGDSIILTGTVASAEEAQKASDIARGFVGDTGSTSGAPSTGSSSGGASSASTGAGAVADKIFGRVINSLTIRGLDEVSLRVTVAEVRREIMKQLGVSWSATAANGSTFNLTNPFAINGPITASVTDTPVAALKWVNGSASLNANIEAYERQGVARTLAEPTVTAVSGESAKFMAGGTVPIPNSQSCTGGLCQIGFIQQPYGVTLNFTPVVLSEGRIQLRIATEVTEIDSSKQLDINGLTIPGFRTRNNVTTVELPSGGSIATAGLISTQSQQAVNGLPGLMNLPILGTLFRSQDYLRNETELLIIVTPYVVHPLSPREVTTPDKNFQDASDPQRWFLGRVNRIYAPAGTLQLMPGIAGQYGFITE